MEYDTRIFPCPDCGASTTQAGKTQPGVTLVPETDLVRWQGMAQDVARMLTLVRESMTAQPEDLAENIEQMERQAWDLAHGLQGVGSPEAD
jgi:hypothetical protein